VWILDEGGILSQPIAWFATLAMDLPIGGTFLHIHRVPIEAYALVGKTLAVVRTLVVPVTLHADICIHLIALLLMLTSCCDPNDITVLVLALALVRLARDR